MPDRSPLNQWFCREVLTLERSLTSFIRRNWRVDEEVADLRQEIYERVLVGARHERPRDTRAFVYSVARNHLINRARRAQIVLFDLVADLESVGSEVDVLATERHLDARDQLRRAQVGLERLPPLCREVVRLRKVEGLSTREVADRLGVGLHTVEKQTTLGMRALADFMLRGPDETERPAALTSLWRKRS